MIAPVVPTHRELPSAAKLRMGAEVLVSYAHVRWLMRNQDATAAVRVLRARGLPAPAVPARDARVASVRLAWVVRRVLRRLPTDSRCLFSSLTLLSLLSRRGIDCRLIIAVRPEPFAAHAWVERDDGRALLDPGDPELGRLLEL